MATSTEFADHMLDLLSPLGPVAAQRMFGGYGLKLHGVNFAILVDDEAYFRVADAMRPAYEARGSAPFRYETKRGTVTVGSYWLVPSEVLEDEDMVAAWARAAVDAADAAPPAKRRRKTA